MNFLPGKTYRIKTVKSSRNEKWVGFEVTVDPDQTLVGTEYDSIWCTPLADRPDGYHRSSFYWDSDDLEPVFKPGDPITLVRMYPEEEPYKSRVSDDDDSRYTNDGVFVEYAEHPTGDHYYRVYLFQKEADTRWLNTGYAWYVCEIEHRNEQKTETTETTDTPSKTESEESDMSDSTNNRVTITEAYPEWLNGMTGTFLDDSTVKLDDSPENRQRAEGHGFDFDRWIERGYVYVDRTEPLGDGAGDNSTAYKTEIAKLSREIADLKAEISKGKAFLDRLVTDAHEYADENNLCDRFDDFMEEHGLPRREMVQDWTVTLTVTIKGRQASLEEPSESDVRDALYNMDRDDLHYYVTLSDCEADGDPYRQD